MGLRIVFVALAAGLALALLGCHGRLVGGNPDGPPPPMVDGGFGFDAGRPGVDAGRPGVDSGRPGVDSGGGGVDAGPGCVPDCSGRTCGDDGCSGSCGMCGSGTMCSDGTCVSTGPMCGNGMVEAGELCDGDCPTSCPSAACSTGTLVGSAASCNARCESTPITACASGDGCCPSGCSPLDDSDCAYDCTNLASWPADWAAQEQIALDEMNRHRSTGYMCASGPMPAAPPLTMNAAARIAARCHSQDMAENNFFSHTGSDGSSFSTRMRNAGYTGTPRNENIAAGNSGGVATNNQWMGSSSGHCDAVMTSGNTEVGIGYFRLAGTTWTHYWTANFGR